MEMSDETRRAVKEQLEAFDKAYAALAMVRKPFDDACKPFNDMRDAIDEAREILLEQFGGDVSYCEGCRKPLFAGDLVHVDGGEDRMIYCEECAPTYEDWQDAINSRKAQRGEDGESDEVDDLGTESIRAHFAAGGSLNDKLQLFPL